MRGEDFFAYSSLVYYENAIYYLTEAEEKLVKIDLSTKELSVVFQISKDNIYCAYRKIVLCGDTLYLIPYYTTVIVSVNLKNDCICETSLPVDVTEKIDGKPVFFGAYVDGNTIFMFGFKPIVVCYNIDTQKFLTYEVEVGTKKFGSWFRSGICKVNNEICIPFNAYPYYFEISDNVGKIKRIQFNDTNEYGFSEVFHYKDSICFLRENNEGKVWIDLFNRGLSQIPDKSYKLEISDFANKNRNVVPFLAGRIIGDILYLFPGYGNQFCFLNLLDGTFEYKVIEKDELENTNLGDGRRFVDIVVNCDYMYSLLYRSNHLYRIEDVEIEKYDLCLSKGARKDNIASSNIIFEEKNVAELGEYIAVLL